ncbi:GNAT family N-acetyltransferase [Asanoa sp. NPDC049573]|uniref:GNAT family N-acetyltransferase n=1 Tax=Asanoa sp. NPDC049573 TaxID=3155396 RepID=UPI0034303AC6
MRFRAALTSDAPAVAALHADSWRRYYRGAYADAYLDGDIDADRLAIWSARLTAADSRRVTIVAETDALVPPRPRSAPVTSTAGIDGMTRAGEDAPGEPATPDDAAWRTGAATQSDTRQLATAASTLVGFVHLVVDDDPRWGSLIDNLHVLTGRQRGGVGSALIRRAAEAAAERGALPGLYLWVQEQNTAAQAFYAAHGGQVVETAQIEPPGGVPGRLHGRPRKLRVAWPDARTVARPPRP